jgi:Ca2+-binding RTX toxin-like protein
VVPPSVDTAPAPVLAGSGAQTLAGGMGADDLKGGLGADNLNGGDGADRLRGEGGADTLVGGGGGDTLSGGAGADLMTGGPGNDVFQVIGPIASRNAADVDRITDFTHGQDHLSFGDALKLTDGHFLTASANSYGDALTLASAKIASGADDAVAVQVGADVVVFADSHHTNHADVAVILVGRTLAGIGMGDFL